MDCPVIQGELIGYHFATIPEEARERVDGHLLGCQGCLRAYLSLKREIETGGAMDEVPSAAARERLRQAVARSFRPGALARLRLLAQRPIPLYQGVMAAVLLLCFWALLPPVLPLLVGRQPRVVSGEGPFLPGRTIDTARQTAESLTIY